MQSDNHQQNAKNNADTVGELLLIFTSDLGEEIKHDLCDLNCAMVVGFSILENVVVVYRSS